MIQIRNLEKTFGPVRAAAGVTFDVCDGEITALLGLNGSGKSTTLRAIAGTLQPDSGSISIDGIDPTVTSRRALQSLGVFPDRFGLYPRLTVRELLAHSARLREVADPDSAIRAVSEQIGLHDILDRRAEGFSEGQRMRTGIALALLHQPQNIVLDEPTRGLDVVGVRQLRALLRSLRNAGRAVLCSSHVLAEIEELADRLVVLHAGRVVASESPSLLRGEALTLEDAVIDLTGAAA